MSDKIDPWFREWLIKERLKHSISARFFVRYHVALILACAVAVGWAANRLLYVLDVKNMLIRHPLAVVAAYVGFLVGLRAWIRYSGIREYVNSRRAKELLEPEGFKPRDPPRGDGLTLDVPALDGEGCFLILAFLALLILAFALGGYLIVFAADLMAELVFELLLAAGLIRGIRRVDLLADLGIPRISLWALAAALAASLVFGALARHKYPGATTIGDVVRDAMANKRTR